MTASYLDTFTDTAGTHLVTGSPLHVANSGGGYTAYGSAVDAEIAAGGVGVVSTAVGAFNYVMNAATLGLNDPVLIDFLWPASGSFSLSLSSRAAATGAVVIGYLDNTSVFQRYEFSSGSYAGGLGASPNFAGSFAASATYRWLQWPSGAVHRDYFRRDSDGLWLVPAGSGFVWNSFRQPVSTFSFGSDVAGSPLIGTAPAGTATISLAAGGSDVVLIGDGGILSFASDSITYQVGSPAGGNGTVTTTLYLADVTASGSYAAIGVLTPGTPLTASGLIPGHQYDVKAVATDGTNTDTSAIQTVTLPALATTYADSVLDTFTDPDGTPLLWPGHVSDSGDTLVEMPNDFSSAVYDPANIVGNRPYAAITQDPLIRVYATKVLPLNAPVSMLITLSGSATSSPLQVGPAYRCQVGGAGLGYTGSFNTNTGAFTFAYYHAGTATPKATWTPTALLPAGTYKLIVVPFGPRHQFFLQKTADSTWLTPSTTIAWQSDPVPFFSAVDVNLLAPGCVGIYLEAAYGYADAALTGTFSAGEIVGLYSGSLGSDVVRDTWARVCCTVAHGGYQPVAYSLKRQSGGSGPFDQVAAPVMDGSTPNVNYYDLGLSPSTSYAYRLDATDAMANTVSSPVLTVTTAAGLPAESAVSIPAPAVPQTAWPTHGRNLDVYGVPLQQSSLSILYLPTTGQFFGAWMHMEIFGSSDPSKAANVHYGVSDDLVNWLDLGLLADGTLLGTLAGSAIRQGIYRPTLFFAPPSATGGAIGKVFCGLHCEAPTAETSDPLATRQCLLVADTLSGGPSGFALYGPGMFTLPYTGGATYVAPHDSGYVVDPFGGGSLHIYTSGYDSVDSSGVNWQAQFTPDLTGFVGPSAANNSANGEGCSPFYIGDMNCLATSGTTGWAPNSQQGIWAGIDPTFDNGVAGAAVLIPAASLFTSPVAGSLAPDSAIIIDGGSGYTSAPTGVVTDVLASGSGGAVAFAVAGGSVVSAAPSGGSGYSEGLSVAISGGGGSGAVVLISSTGDPSTSYNSQPGHVWQSPGGVSYYLADDNANGQADVTANQSVFNNMFLPLSISDGVPTIPYADSAVPEAGLPSSPTLAAAARRGTVALAAAPPTSTATATAAARPGVAALAAAPAPPTSTATATAAARPSVAALAATAAGVTPPTIGPIAVAPGGVDVITYPAPAAGSSAVAGVALYVAPAAGIVPSTPAAVNSGAGSGAFIWPAAHPGSAHYYSVRPFDVDARFGDASAAVASATPQVVTPPAVPVSGPLPGGGYWLYAPAAGSYLLSLDSTGLAAEPVELPRGDMVVTLPAQGVYAVALVARLSGRTQAFATPYAAP